MGTIFPTAVASLPNPVAALSQADVLALFDRLFPPDYLDAMRTGSGPGYEYLQAVAKVAARLNAAVRALGGGVFFMAAAGGAKATAAVEFYRAGFALGAGAVKAGTRCRTSRGGREFVLLSDVLFSGADAGPHAATLRALWPGEEYNVAGPRTDADGTAVPGEIDTVSFPVQDPPYWDPGVAVRQTADATGGTGSYLDALGRDRGLDRAGNESDDSYRARLVFLPDTVSPAAIERQVSLFLEALGWGHAIVEAGDAALGGVLGAAATPPAPAHLAQFCLSNPLNATGLWGRVLSEATFRAALFVVIDRLPAMEMFGAGLSDTAMTAAAHATAVGRRACWALSVPASYVATLAPALSGTDTRAPGVYRGLYELLQQVKAAGVYATIWINGD